MYLSRTVSSKSSLTSLACIGPTSFLSLQDRLIQVLKARDQVEPQIDPDLVTMAPMRVGKDKHSSQSDKGTPNYTIWRWGCDKLMYVYGGLDEITGFDLPECPYQDSGGNQQ